MEHTYKFNHEVLFSATKVLHHSESYCECVILETVEIRFHGGMANRDAGLQLSSAYIFLSLMQILNGIVTN